MGCENQGCQTKEVIISTKNDVNHTISVTTPGADKSLFSSPQNRRASMRVQRSSLPLLQQFMGSARDSAPNTKSSIGDVGGPRDNSATGGPEVVKLEDVVDDGDTFGDALRAADPVPSSSKTVPVSVKTTATRMQEIVGANPILIVDDSVSIIKMTKSVIQNECANIRSVQPFLYSLISSISYTPYQHDISFMEAKNGKEAFERVAEAISTFELIVTDIQMPVCNGFDFTRKVRSRLLEVDNLFNTLHLTSNAELLMPLLNTSERSANWNGRKGCPPNLSLVSLPMISQRSPLKPKKAVCIYLRIF